MKLAIIDICGTIYNSNTTFDFLDYFLRSNNRYRIFRKFSENIIWRVFNKVMWKIIHVDLTRKFALKYINGLTQKDLQNAAKEFYDNVLSNKVQTPILEIIENLRSENFKIVLASATLDFIALEVAQRNNIQIQFSSQLKYQNHVCAGYLTIDNLGNKLKNLTKNNIPPPYDVVVTDNFSDIDIIKNSKFSYIVTKQNNIKKWDKTLIGNSLDNLKFGYICL